LHDMARIEEHAQIRSAQPVITRNSRGFGL
jgi:hypothetical protein